MRILHILRAPVGGLFRHVCDLAAAQAAEGHAVGVVYDSSTLDALAGRRLEALAAVCALGLVPVRMSRALSHHDVGAVLAVQRAARLLKADVLHGHGAKGGAYARLAARLVSRPDSPCRAFYTPHGGSLHYDRRSLEGRLFLGLERLLDGWTDGLIFESAFSARAYTLKVGAPSAPQRIIPNGLLPHEFSPHEPAPDATDFLYVGELRRLKGVDVLLRALASKDVPPNIRLTIVGDGPDAGELRSLAAELGLTERVAFAGALPAREAFRRGRLLVVPSRAESFPYIVLEAGAAGLPMIATRVGGIPEIVEGTSIDLLPVDDVEALAARMCRFLAHPEPFHSEAAALKRTLAQRLTVETMSHSILEFYQSGRSQAAVAGTKAARPQPARQL